MEDPPKVKIFYNTEETPSKSMLAALSIQQLIVFLPLIVMPIMILLKVSSRIDILYHFLSLAMFGCAISTLFISVRGYIGGSCYLPVTFATPMYALLLIVAPKGDIGIFMSLGVISGLIQLCLTPLIRWTKIVFNMHLAGFITMLLGIWVAQMGIIALFSPDNITPLLFHKAQHASYSFDLKQLLFGFMSLSVIFACRLSIKKKSRMLCLLYGSMAGWLMAIVTGSLSKNKVALVLNAPWFSWPSFSELHFSPFNTNLSIPIVIASVILTMQLYSIMAMIQHDNGGDPRSKAFANRNAKGNIASSLGLIVSSLFGMPQAPNAAAFGVESCTGVFSRKMAYGVAASMSLLAFSPRILMCLITIPASVRGATILFIGSAMFMHGLAIIKLKDLAPLHTLICILSLFLGASITIEPNFYHSSHLWISAVTNPMILIALIVFIGSHLVFYKLKGI
jgi:xanthine/uracil permease